MIRANLLFVVFLLATGSRCSSLDRSARDAVERERRLARVVGEDGSCQADGLFCDCDNLSTVYYCMPTDGGFDKLVVRVCKSGLKCGESTRGCTDIDNPKCTICRGEMRYPDEEDCFFYFDCTSGTAERTKCPDGQSFSRTEAECVDGLVESCDDVDVTTTTTTSPPDPNECAADVRFLYDPSSCVHYFDCHTGVPIRRRCPKLMSFSEKHLVCVHGYVGCM